MKDQFSLTPGNRFASGIRRALFTCLVFQVLGSFSQNNDNALNFKSVESVSYQLYLEQNWDSLIEFGNQAIAAGHDYYYLRLRTGIAYYQKQNYLLASQQFEKARKLNQADPKLLEFLYYSYNLMNRQSEAKTISWHYDGKFPPAPGIQKPRLLEKAYLEGGPVFSDNIEKNRGFHGNDSSYAMQDLNDDKLYLHAGLGLTPASRLSVYLGYTFLQTKKLRQIGIPGTAGNGSSGQQGNNSGKSLDVTSDDYLLYQHGIYANSVVNTGNGFLLVPAVHLLSVAYNTKTAQLQDGLPAITGMDTSFVNAVLSLGVSMTLGKFNASAFGSYSNLNGLDQIQAGTGLTWFPFGNLDLYINPTLILANQEDENRFIFDFLGGVKLAERIWVEGLFTLGEMLNYNENHAFVVHNSGDITRFRAGTNIFLTLPGKIGFSLRYNFSSSESNQIRWDETGIPQYREFNYTNHTLIGGIKWIL